MGCAAASLAPRHAVTTIFAAAYSFSFHHIHDRCDSSSHGIATWQAQCPLRLGNALLGTLCAQTRGVETDSDDPRPWIGEPRGALVQLDGLCQAQERIVRVPVNTIPSNGMAQYKRVGLRPMDEPQGDP